MMNFFSKLKRGLSKTAALFSFSGADDTAFEAIEEALLQADIGYQTTADLLTELRRRRPTDGAQLRRDLHYLLTERLTPAAQPLIIDSSHKPFIVLMIGVNGAGKTTTIGKLGHFYQNRGLQVAFTAGDTFRAGATEQLRQWGERLNCPVDTAETGADAAGLVFDSIRRSRERGDDILFIDTAGRLQNRSDLMAELAKITRVIKKQDPTAPHATLLVLDATVGQNAISQVQTFRDSAGVTGLIMTKLDGTAKGGILVALADRFQLPIHAVGVGEGIDDLNPFTAADYADSLLGGSS